MAPKMYLTTAILRGDTVKVTNPPIDEVHMRVPSMTAGSACSFETVTITTSGDVTFDPPHIGSESCSYMAVPVMYVSHIDSPTLGDMEVEEGAPILNYPNDNLRIFRTRPFPDGSNESVVLLSGVMFGCSVIPAPPGDPDNPPDPGCDVLARLPEGFRPARNLCFICSETGEPLMVKPDGDIFVDKRPDHQKWYMHNVRFIGSTCEETKMVKPRFPRKSLVHRIDCSDGVTWDFAARDFDLYFPTTIYAGEDYESGVTVLTRTGQVFHFAESPTPEAPVEVLSDVLLSSLFTCAIPGGRFRSPAMIASTCALPDGSPWEEFRDSVGSKLAALVFSRLSGEKESKSLRRDRTWRQTGVRKTTGA